MTRRARTPRDKQERRASILRAAAQELAAHRYDEVTMTRVATAAGVAKGTPYLYWRTKEELFLDALALEYGEFMAAVARGLDGLDRPPERAVGALIASEVAARPRFAKLMGLLHGVLEQNAPVEAVVAFKLGLVQAAMPVAGALSRCCPWLEPDRAARLLLRVHGAIVAFRQMADPAPAVREALERPELAILRVDLEQELAALVADLLVAARVAR